MLCWLQKVKYVLKGVFSVDVVFMLFPVFLLNSKTSSRPHGPRRPSSPLSTLGVLTILPWHCQHPAAGINWHAAYTGIWALRATRLPARVMIVLIKTAPSDDNPMKVSSTSFFIFFSIYAVQVLCWLQKEKYVFIQCVFFLFWCSSYCCFQCFY